MSKTVLRGLELGVFWGVIVTERPYGVSACRGRALGLIGMSALHRVHRVVDSLVSSVLELDMDSTMAGPTESCGGAFEKQINFEPWLGAFFWDVPH